MTRKKIYKENKFSDLKSYSLNSHRKRRINAESMSVVSTLKIGLEHLAVMGVGEVPSR